MRILVDVGHPAHVHLFKNMIWVLEGKGHQVQITTRDKDVTLKLLDAYKFNYHIRGSVYKTAISKTLGLFITDLNLLSIAKKFNPDILIGVHNPYVAHVGKILKKTVIIFTDTEHAKFAGYITFPFSDIICTPSCFKLDLGTKHMKYNGYHELAYLHPKYFNPNPSVLNELNLSIDEKFVILRFVEWSANHDIGHTGISLKWKKMLCNELRKQCRVIISSEIGLPPELEQYKSSISPEKMHDLMFYCSLLIGESATMASESAVLGTPSIYIDFIGRGYTQEEEDKYGLVFNFKKSDSALNEALKKAQEILGNIDSDKIFLEKRNMLINDTIDVTAYMVDLIENIKLK